MKKLYERAVDVVCDIAISAQPVEEKFIFGANPKALSRRNVLNFAMHALMPEVSLKTLTVYGFCSQ